MSRPEPDTREALTPVGRESIKTATRSLKRLFWNCALLERCYVAFSFSEHHGSPSMKADHGRGLWHERAAIDDQLHLAFVDPLDSRGSHKSWSSEHSGRDELRMGLPSSIDDGPGR